MPGVKRKASPPPLVYALVYVSQSTYAFDDAALDDLLQVSRRRNAALGITGALVVMTDPDHSLHFAQLLEGSKAAVKSTFGRICADERHTKVVTLWEGVLPNGRLCGEWDMAMGDYVKRLDAQAEEPVLQRFAELSSTSKDSQLPPLMDLFSSAVRTSAAFAKGMPGTIVSARERVTFAELEDVHLIGQGAMGNVFRASWRGSIVAVKRMGGGNSWRLTMSEEDGTSRSPAQNDTWKQILLNEVATMLQLKPHPHVVRLVGVCPEPLAIIMEYAERGSLHALLHSSQALDLVLRASMARDAAAGMEHLHKEGIVHKDLASRNILIDTAFRARIADFGLARPMDEEKGAKVMVALRWAAPEVMRGADFDTRSDVYSFGVVLVEILSRKAPAYSVSDADFKTMAPEAIVAAFTEAVRKAAGQCGSAPAEAEIAAHMVSMSARCLSLKRTERPEFAAMREELTSWLVDASSDSPEGSASIASMNGLISSVSSNPHVYVDPDPDAVLAEPQGNIGPDGARCV